MMDDTAEQLLQLIAAKKKIKESREFYRDAMAEWAGVGSDAAHNEIFQSGPVLVFDGDLFWFIDQNREGNLCAIPVSTVLYPQPPDNYVLLADPYGVLATYGVDRDDERTKFPVPIISATPVDVLESLLHQLADFPVESVDSGAE